MANDRKVAAPGRIFVSPRLIHDPALDKVTLAAHSLVGARPVPARPTATQQSPGMPGPTQQVQNLPVQVPFVPPAPPPAPYVMGPPIPPSVPVAQYYQAQVPSGAFSYVSQPDLSAQYQVGSSRQQDLGPVYPPGVVEGMAERSTQRCLLFGAIGLGLALLFRGRGG